MTKQEAIDYFGSAAALARALGIKPPSLHSWGDRPPLPRQYQIQVLTKNKLRVSKPEAA